MKLSELREQWEKGYHEVGVSIHNISDYKTIYVYLLDPKAMSQPDYSLHRYFTIAGKWNVSVDVSHGTLEDCVNYVSDDMMSLYPKEEVPVTNG